VKTALPEVCRAAERHSMETYGLREGAFMERASLGAWEVFRKVFPQAKRMAILCGPGSNGGDGLAMARHAWVDGFRPIVVLVGSEPKPGSAASKQLAIVRRMGIETTTWSAFWRSEDFGAGQDLYGVDALFGTGLRRPLVGESMEAAQWLSRRPTLALDLPSGLDGATGQPTGTCVVALHTATFARSKPGLHLHPGRDHAGAVHVVEIGLPQASWTVAGEAIELLDDEWAKGRLAPRSRGAHKGDAGRAFLLCGSDEYFGAAVLAVSAALRSGAGLLQVASTEFVASRIALSIPEAMGFVGVGEEVDVQEVSNRIERAAAVLAGPGLGKSEAAKSALQRVLERTGSPLVLDADALNLVSAHPDLRQELSRIAKRHGLVLTPHPLEASRLLAEPTEALLADPIQAARKLSKAFGAVVVFKTATPVVASPGGELAIGVAGHEGMAVGGCGDALAGAVVARLAEGVAPFEAACQAVRAHARAGELAGMRGRRGMSVTDLIAALPQAWEEMEL
jgi:NAD(P)H-hydrate epimerase